MQDQEMQEMMKDAQQNGEGSAGQGLPEELKDKLTPEEQQQLEDAVKEAIEKQLQKASEQEGQPSPKDRPQGAPIDLDSLSDELKQKIRDYIDSLPEDVKKELEERAQAALHEFEKELNEELQGKLSENPEQAAEREAAEQKPGDKEGEPSKPAIPKPTGRPRTELDEAELKKYRDMLAKEVKKDANVYEEYRNEVLPIIDKLEQDLREIFVERRARGWKGGFKAGKRIDIKRRIQEKAKDVPVIESRAWLKRELPKEKDYAISVLVDLSGSMQNEKIKETFKAVIVLAEVLNRLSINLEILGFNDRIYEYQNFGQPISKAVREKMGGMLEEVYDSSDTGKAQWNDDGWALKQTSERLAKQKADQKFLIVLSDGEPAESPMHPASRYDLETMIKEVLEQTDQKLIGLGIGRGTRHVANYYPNSLADVNIREMATKLADLIEEVIANYGNF